jgi:hypothetical protein
LRDQTDEAIEVIRKSGLTIIPVPKGEALNQFHAIGVEVTRKLTGKVFPKKLLDRVYMLLKRPNG